MTQPSDSICAVGTPPGRGAIAVVRVSGPRAHAILGAVAGAIPADRTMRLRRVRDARGDVIDEGLVVAFPGHRAPTGEPYGELHLHGGAAVISAALDALTQAGARIAQPGEFSRRALSAGKMDLTQIEGLADLIDAETEAQRRQASRLMQGALRDRASAWRGTIVTARALLEAAIDFADEAEIPAAAEAQARDAIGSLVAAIDGDLVGFRAAVATREGLEVALVGPPNAGKSSLLNAIAGREVALTSSIPGTTRDAIEVRCALGGRLVTLVDTAGQRDTADPLERAGVDWARRRAAGADLRVVVRAPDALATPEHRPDDLLVWNKSDLAAPGAGDGLAVSARTGAGVAALLEAVEARLRPLTMEQGVVVRERQRAALAAARDHAVRALGAPAEIAAEELRAAAKALDGLVGGVDVDDVLDEIFSRFCLGK